MNRRNDWYVVDPLGRTQINQVALEEILFAYCKQFRKELKIYKGKRKWNGK